MDERRGRTRITLGDLRPDDDDAPEPIEPEKTDQARVKLPRLGRLDADEAAAELARSPVSAVRALPTLEGVVIASRYGVEASIGEGGMGRVLRVRHHRLDKSFALKLMQTGFAGDPEARDQFYREARLASSLAHPNIVSVIDFGEDYRFGAYMVMELLEGETLSRRLERDRRFAIRHACEVIMQVAEALHYIHQREVVHCDIKPDNILLVASPPGERRKDQVKLLDFGLARVRSTSAARAAVVAGTPEYMAPERIAGEEPRPSMDIYGLGIMAYELLTGTTPFRGPVESVARAHLYTAPPPMATWTSEPVEDRAEQLVMKALAKDPADRHKDMAGFIYELRTLIDMLGFGRQRRKSLMPVRPVVDPREQQARAESAAFQLSPVPMAGIDVDGSIVVANQALRRLLLGDAADPAAVLPPADEGFREIHPELAADLRHVHVRLKSLRRVVEVPVADGERRRMLLAMAPGSADAGDVQIALYDLET